MKKIIYILLTILVSHNVFAERTPQDGKIDPRMKLLIYNKQDVYQIHGHYGYTSHILFDESESITHISIGDSVAWSVVPQANHLFLKPIENNADTNLTVLTNKRYYSFDLKASEASHPDDKTLTFSISFRYPEQELKESLQRQRLLKEQENELTRQENELIATVEKNSPLNWNFNYTRKGSDITAPTQVLDDGKFTYFEFPPELDTPAIFLVDEHKNESLINYHVEGKYIVVQRVGAQFILRHGENATCIFNESFNERRTPSKLPIHTEEKQDVAKARELS